MSEVDNIIIEYDNQITDIDIQYINEIDNIIVSVGDAAQSVFSVNSLTGNVNLTSYGTLSSGTSSAGIYFHTFTHSLNYENPIVFLYNPGNQLVFSDVEIIDSNNVTIKAAIDLSGYKVVVQR
jgi:cytochrome c oxidase assembly protein Cox11